MAKIKLCLSELNNQILEESDFMSLNYVPEEDEGYTCRFIFNDPDQGRVVQDQVAQVDVISKFLSFSPGLVVQFVAESRFANCEFANLFLPLTNCNFLDFKSRTNFSSILMKSRQN